MVRTVLRTRIDHSAATGSPAALVRYFNRVAELEAVLNASRRALGFGLAPVAEVKNLLKEPAAKAVCTILGMVEAHASETGKTKLALEAHVVPSDFEGGELDAANQMLNLLQLITSPISAVLKADHGLTDAALTEAYGVVDEFARAVGSPRSAFANQAGHQAIIDYAVGEIRRVLDTQLDPLARQFDLKPNDSGSISKKMWFDAYTAARVIVDLAPGSGTAATPTVPAPPQPPA
jgi:hypothetical protein